MGELKMPKLSVLFVCHGNLNRSPRAEEVFKRIAGDMGLDTEVSSAGTNATMADMPKERLIDIWGVPKSTQLTREMAHSADIVYALDANVEETLVFKYTVPQGKIVCLHIKDRYLKSKGNLEELYALLEQKLEPIVSELLKSQNDLSTS